MEIKTTYQERCLMREQTLDESTTNLIKYFIGLGDDETTAKSKVTQVSTKVAAFLYPYVKGNVSSLIDALNAVDEVELPFFDAAAKAQITGDLSNAVI